MNTFDVSLDLDKGVTRQPQVVRIRQADHDGTTIHATIYDHGVPLASTPSACSFAMRLPDGAHYYRKSATYADGVASVTIDETQAASVAGRTVLAYFSVTFGTSIYSTGAFAVIVEPSATVGAVLPESVDDAIEDYVREYISEGGVQLVQTVVNGDLQLSLA